MVYNNEQKPEEFELVCPLRNFQPCLKSDCQWWQVMILQKNEKLHRLPGCAVNFIATSLFGLNITISKGVNQNDSD